MGPSYDIFPLQDFGRDQNAIAAMLALGVTPADWKPNYRYPSLEELRIKLARLEEFEIESDFADGASWQLSLVSNRDPSYEHAILECREYGGNPKESRQFHFYRGDPETMVLITRSLTDTLGPVILMCEYGEAVLVRENTDPNVEWIELNKFEG
jgi:hypothetical protein